MSRPSNASSAIIKTNRLLFLLLLLAGCHKAPAPVDPPSITILCYHNFDSPKITPYTVTGRMLEKQMRFLAAQKIPVIPLAQLMDYLQGHGAVPDRAAVITIDDGYKTAKTIAWPLFRHYGFPFTIFVYPQFIDQPHPSALTWDDVREMNKAGVDVEGHSLTHPLLTNPPHAMALDEYLPWVDQELQGSKAEIEQQLGHPIRFIAYPFGGYDQRIVERTRKAGYEAGLTCDDGNVNHWTDVFHLNRRLVLRQIRLGRFAQYFQERELQVRDLRPQDGERVRRHIDRISGQIINWEQVDPASVSIFVDKMGHHPFKLVPNVKTGHFELPIPAHSKPGYYFLSLTARDKTNPRVYREASWIFIYSKNASK